MFFPCAFPAAPIAVVVIATVIAAIARYHWEAARARARARVRDYESPLPPLPPLPPMPPQTPLPPMQARPVEDIFAEIMADCPDESEFITNLNELSPRPVVARAVHFAAEVSERVFRALSPPANINRQEQEHGHQLEEYHREEHHRRERNHRRERHHREEHHRRERNRRGEHHCCERNRHREHHCCERDRRREHHCCEQSRSHRRHYEAVAEAAVEQMFVSQLPRYPYAAVVTYQYHEYHEYHEYHYYH